MRSVWSFSPDGSRLAGLAGDSRSILLHELVHHVQGITGRFDSLPDCDAWYAREFEAYARGRPKPIPSAVLDDPWSAAAAAGGMNPDVTGRFCLHARVSHKRSPRHAPYGCSVRP